MNRTIKFRALAQNQDDNKGWVYGSLIVYNDTSKAIQEEKTDKIWPVVDGTQGQYTGLKDKNGVEIYEGDKLRRQNYTSRGKKMGSDMKVIVWSKGRNGFNIISNKKQLHKDLWEIIGNISENPKLLK